MNRPGVGVAVVISRDGGSQGFEYLLGLRKGGAEIDTWCFPGGHLEGGEAFLDCVKRETMEETGIVIDKAGFLGVTNDVMKFDDKHYVTLFFSATIWNGTAKVMEPDKCVEWKWFGRNNLPPNLSTPTANYFAGRMAR